MWFAPIVVAIFCTADDGIEQAMKDLDSSDLTTSQTAGATLLDYAQNGSDMVQEQLLADLFLLNDRKWKSFRLELIYAIAVSNPDAFASSLEKLRNWIEIEQDVASKERILKIIGVLGEKASALLPTVKEFRSQRHTFFVQALARYATLRLTSGEQGRDDLAGFVKSREARERWMAALMIRILIDFGDKQFEPYLNELIEDKHVTVRVCAADAMLSLGENERAVTVLCQSLVLPREEYRTSFVGDVSLGHKVAAVLALSRTDGFRELAPSLCILFEDDDIILHQVLMKTIIAKAGDSDQVFEKLESIIPKLHDERGKQYATRLAGMIRTNIDNKSRRKY